MADVDREESPREWQGDEDHNEEHDDGGVATEVRPAPAPVARLPQWSVLLHNDDFNDIEYVILTILELTSVVRFRAIRCTLEAHDSGVGLILHTHREHAELLCERFMSKGLTVTAEPARA